MELTSRDLKGPRKKVNEDTESAYRLAWMDKALKKKQSLEDQGIKTDVLYEKRSERTQSQHDNIVDVLEDEYEPACVVCGEPVAEDWHKYCPKCHLENEPDKEHETTLSDYEDTEKVDVGDWQP